MVPTLDQVTVDDGLPISFAVHFIVSVRPSLQGNSLLTGVMTGVDGGPEMHCY